ncbi:hypothetical protein SAMN05444360_11850 [Chryseobacterium carnipullorum]|uniref:hypothetical protein n=1 Tax=Chryseobacterium carnipullorum TaxID=1124835 RepID=UPI00091A802A|nr:hypothetical protein [Chryseobacterium carnipullorum]SHM81931.1 hypothetical protein SAMN05444360_11850 [Chryseobacterium carnipullorum]
MIDHLKKYWMFLFIALIGINYAGFYLLKESIGISDALEHVESETVIRKLKQKDFLYTLFVDAVMILDFSLILFLLFMGGRKIVQLIVKE